MPIKEKKSLNFRSVRNKIQVLSAESNALDNLATSYQRFFGTEVMHIQQMSDITNIRYN